MKVPRKTSETRFKSIFLLPMIRFDSLPPEVMQAMCTPMHQILSPSIISGSRTGSLYIGSLSAVNDIDLLRDHRISHLVQVLDAPWLPVSEADGFDCHRISILDHNTVDLKPHLESACNYIDRALRSGRNVLVHCQQVSTSFSSFFPSGLPFI